MKEAEETRARENERLLARELMKSTAYLRMHKCLMACYKPNFTAFLCNLTDREDYLRQTGKLQEDGSFYFTYKEQTKQIGLSKYELSQCKKLAEEKGILKTEKRGIPVKEFYILDFHAVAELVRECLPAEAGDVYRNRSKIFTNYAEKSSPINTENKYKENKVNEGNSVELLIGNEVSNDAENNSEKPKKRHSQNIRPHPVFQQWNDWQDTPNHRLDTKTAKDINKMLRELEDGTFFTKRHINTEMLEDGESRLKEASVGWDAPSMHRALTNVRKAFRPGYMPKNKTWLHTRGLRGILYSPHDHRSLFLEFYYSPPKKIQEVVEKQHFEKMSDSALRIYTRIHKSFDRSKDTEKIRKRIREISSSFAEFWDVNGKPVMSGCFSVTEPEDLADLYLEAFNTAYAGWRDWNSTALWGQKVQAELEKKYPDIYMMVQRDDKRSEVLKNAPSKHDE